MHLLILGYSSIVRRRVLPAARSVGAFTWISVASRSRAAGPAEDGPRLHVDAWFGDYSEALTASGADVVYVSGPNVAHAEWATRALERGLHVIVDKPAFPDARSARAAVALARARRRLLAEATVFPYHPQFDVLQSLVAGAPAGGRRVALTFCIPPLPVGDFRYRPDCDGGSLYDQGPYVAAVNRLIFRAPPDTVACTVLSAADVDTAFAFLLAHRHGGAMTGHCGLTSAYQNRLSIVTPARTLQVDRVFSPPADYEGRVIVADDDGERTIPIVPADSFANFLAAVAAAVDRGGGDEFESALLDDAALLERLRHSALDGGGRG